MRTIRTALTVIALAATIVAAPAAAQAAGKGQVAIPTEAKLGFGWNG
ncbi:hypothetical protein KC207_10815 [Phycicoccus sp. BSK3Z-2]|uniref:Uncharacterized protein n=1 Tax=Phycicoccus avicenniae TaxID=2828860 RepID=A0A941I103_9MICO|nr:hypothetical protein [Phycicoccus avicenniae]MBR7743781.1 hypothetical protein [Phycicoccus avicenniae]